MVAPISLLKIKILNAVSDFFVILSSVGNIGYISLGNCRQNAVF